jgi:hypothetical protein
VIAKAHVPIAIATRVVTCSTTRTTSSERFALRTPTRFGNVSAQPTLFLDLAGELWQ